MTTERDRLTEVIEALRIILGIARGSDLLGNNLQASMDRIERRADEALHGSGNEAGGQGQGQATWTGLVQENAALREKLANHRKRANDNWVGIDRLKEENSALRAEVERLRKDVMDYAKSLDDFRADNARLTRELEAAEQNRRAWERNGIVLAANAIRARKD